MKRVKLSPRLMPDVLGKLIRYVFTGGAAAFVDVGGFGLLRAVQVPVIAAAAGSFLAATLVNFLLSAQWVFGAPATRERFARFFLGTLAGLTVNVTVTVTGLRWLRLPWVLAKGLGVAVAFVLNFWINATLVFRGTPDGRLAASHAAGGCRYGGTLQRSNGRGGSRRRVRGDTA